MFSGFDESESGQRKKYPFELEKAIHNVMFIQHHIQRQDQFNAVNNFHLFYLCIIYLYKYWNNRQNYAIFSCI